MKVGVVLPTYKDKNRKWEYFENFMIPSLKYLKGLPFTWLINFQKYSSEDIERLVSKIKLVTDQEVKFIFSEYSEPISMALIREQTAKIDETMDLYLLFDDDMKINSISVKNDFEKCINLFKNLPEVGALMCSGFLGGYRNKGHFIESGECIWWTNRGLFLRNIFQKVGYCLTPPETWVNAGTYEELCAVYIRFHLGFLGFKIFNVNITHKPTSVNTLKEWEVAVKNKNRYENLNTELHNPNLQQNIEWIKNMWKDEFKSLSSSKLPNKLQKIYESTLKNSCIEKCEII